MQLEIVKTQRLYLKVAEQITRLVNDGEIKPGEKLPSERLLAEKLGVSRPTIRESMIALEIAGIVEIRTGSGIYITDQKPALSIQDGGVGPYEILDARYVVESEACAMAAKLITPDELMELQRVIEDMEEEEKRADASERADMNFHLIIAKATQNSAIYAMVKWLWELRNQSHLSQVFMERLRKEGIHPSIREHKRIVTALAKQDPERAREAMKLHIEAATEAATTYFDGMS
ncbi:FadR/GntR family transcriptional regulator [Alteromonas sp. KUL49]|uniref:FadR/GntR family transcriptional regulator n=1 Tax=Alteromonas sp. KUL49 TaxID=2480798 RepID=UPI00102F26F5|nr:FadR/GntR family transcriptional regulator [Alteromonas sp. KUL49]TAP42281.1 FadR family transcriptional regulator [Alteromonas sp. KUL49]GEA09887.1 GntR family transcriptional regulator [Alteromonas sp. KUL49]